MTCYESVNHVLFISILVKVGSIVPISSRTARLIVKEIENNGDLNG
jgi:phospholipid N-methyltransferase